MAPPPPAPAGGTEDAISRRDREGTDQTWKMTQPGPNLGGLEEGLAPVLLFELQVNLGSGLVKPGSVMEGP